MNIRYLKHNEIDKIKWDHTIKNSFNHLPYAYSWYLDCVCPNWHALVTENYEFVFPITLRRKAGVKYLYQPYFTQQLGLFSVEEFSSSELKNFLRIAGAKFRFIEINLNASCLFLEMRSETRITHHLELSISYDNIFKSFNENTRRNIRKADKNNFTLIQNNDSNTLIKIFASETGKKTNLKSKDYLLLELLIHQAIKKRTGKIFHVINNDGIPCAGMFLLDSKKIMINLFNCATTESKNLGAMYFLFNELIKMHSNSDMIFDFEGSEIPEVARFYKGFGGAVVRYPYYRRNHLHWSLKWLKQ